MRAAFGVLTVGVEVDALTEPIINPRDPFGVGIKPMHVRQRGAHVPAVIGRMDAARAHAFSGV